MFYSSLLCDRPNPMVCFSAELVGFTLQQAVQLELCPTDKPVVLEPEEPGKSFPGSQESKNYT